MSAGSPRYQAHRDVTVSITAPEHLGEADVARWHWFQDEDGVWTPVIPDNVHANHHFRGARGGWPGAPAPRCPAGQGGPTGRRWAIQAPAYADLLALRRRSSGTQLGERKQLAICTRANGLGRRVERSHFALQCSTSKATHRMATGRLTLYFPHTANPHCPQSDPRRKCVCISRL